MRNLDSEWVNEHPAKTREERTLTFMGVPVVRKNEIPLSAFRIVEHGDPNAITPVLDAIKSCIEPESWPAYDQITQRDDCTIARLMQLWSVLMEEGGGRPTRPDAASSTGPSGNGTPSTDGRSTSEGWGSGDLVPGASPISPTPTSSPAA